MYYYCYISHSKVDQLLAAFERGEQVEWHEQVAQTKEGKGSAGLSGLLSLFKADISYGRTDMFQKNETLKRSYVHKLKLLLEQLAPFVRRFEWGDGAVPEFARYCLFESTFTVQEVDEANLMASIRTSDGNKALLLDCSMKYFSDELVEGDRVRITSTNYRFFKKNMPVTFETVFHLMQRDGDSFVGSPIYLKLAAVEGLVL